MLALPALGRDALFRRGGQQANAVPRLIPRTRAGPLGKAAECAFFLLHRMIGSRLLLQGPGGQGPELSYRFPGTQKVLGRYRSVTCQSVFLKRASECRQVLRLCKEARTLRSQQERGGRPPPLLAWHCLPAAGCIASEPSGVGCGFWNLAYPG